MEIDRESKTNLNSLHLHQPLLTRHLPSFLSLLLTKFDMGMNPDVV